jgi:DNA-binding NarL/FixJ family response regulator
MADVRIVLSGGNPAHSVGVCPRIGACAARQGGGQAVRVSGGTATDREMAVVAAVIVAGSEKAAAYRLGRSHSTVKDQLANARSEVGAATTAQLVWILARRLPEVEGTRSTDE